MIGTVLWEELQMFGKAVLAGALVAAASLAQAQEVRIGVNLPYTGVGAELVPRASINPVASCGEERGVNPSSSLPTRSASAG